MESYVCNERGVELIGFCKEQFNGGDIALKFDQSGSSDRVFVRTLSPDIISVIFENFPIKPGSPGFEEFISGRWTTIGRTDWFENNMTFHFSNAS